MRSGFKVGTGLIVWTMKRREKIEGKICVQWAFTRKSKELYSSFMWNNVYIGTLRKEIKFIRHVLLWTSSIKFSRNLWGVFTDEMFWLAQYKCLSLLCMFLHICYMESANVAWNSTKMSAFCYFISMWYWYNIQRNGHVSQAGEKRQNKLPQFMSVIFFSLKYVNRMHTISRGPPLFK
jgi:hypothetical protein